MFGPAYSEKRYSEACFWGINAIYVKASGLANGLALGSDRSGLDGGFLPVWRAYSG